MKPDYITNPRWNINALKGWIRFYTEHPDDRPYNRTNAEVISWLKELLETEMKRS
jgi:hypothetical protein